MALYDSTIPQMKKMLNNLAKWLDNATTVAEKKSFDPNTWLTARLAVDQYALVRQVQAACDTAKFVASRLSGKEAPSHPDTEKTMDELKARIGKVVAFLETIKPADFAGVETRKIPLPFMEGKALLGADYVNELAVPNFYFHVGAAYQILRHYGVEVGKRDFLGDLKLQDL